MNSNLTNKADLNFASAEFLHKHNHYCSVIHCSYYSSVQLMQHILIHRIGKNATQAKMDASDATRGSHEILISEIAKYISTVNKKEISLFNNYIVPLKKLRVKADYQDVGIDYNESKTSLELASAINKVLKKAI